MLKRKLAFVLLSTALVSISFTSKPTIKPAKVNSSIIEYNVYATDVWDDVGSPQELNINLYTDHPEEGWWKARVKIRMYFDGATGHYEGVFPFRHFVTEWGWGYRTYDAEMPPEGIQFDTLWGLQEGELVDGTDVTILSFQPE